VQHIDEIVARHAALMESTTKYGYATEMAAAVIQHGFATLALPKIFALAHPENLASLAVMRRLGRTEIGPNRIYYEGMTAEVCVLETGT
jgi:RimJ/RimL family protein N-acetyltransferase